MEAIKRVRSNSVRGFNERAYRDSHCKPKGVEGVFTHSKLNYIFKDKFKEKNEEWGHMNFVRPSANRVESKFKDLATEWKNETKGLSLAASKITNAHYKEIIQLGLENKQAVIKLILQDLLTGTSYWHYALKKLTNDNPVPKDLHHNTQKTRDIWLNWGFAKGIIKV